MAIATLIENDRSFRVRVRKDKGVLSASRTYLVTGAIDQFDALNADGLPAHGAPFDGSHPKVKATSFEPQLEPGSDGFYRVVVGYKEDTLGSYTPTDGFGITTEIMPSLITQPIWFGINGLQRVSNDGSPIPVTGTAILFNVRQYTSAPPDLGPFIALCSPLNKVNANAIVLPNYMGTGVGKSFLPKQLRYQMFTPSMEGELFVINHTLVWSLDWQRTVVREDAAGNAIPNPVPFDIYEPVVFPTI